MICARSRHGWVWALVAAFVGCQRARIDEITFDPTLESDATLLIAEPTDWPGWWGPHRNGTSDATQIPLAWSVTQNVVWSSTVAGQGHASPCIVGDQIFLATALKETEQQSLVCLDRTDGSPRWTRVLHEGGFMRMHGKNSQASATPTCDGQRVFTAFINGGALRVSAVNLDGQVAWQTSAGAFRSEHGYGSSPVLFNNLVIVLGDNLRGSFVAALDRATGEIAWRTARPTGGHASYATPVVAHLAEKDQLIVSGVHKTVSYDPVTGELIWSCDGPAEVTACAVAWDDQRVFVSGGYPEKELLAIRADGDGDVTQTHTEWRSAKGVTYVPSPIYHEGKLFVINDQGVATCFDSATGETLKKKRLGGGFSASPILLEDHLLVTNESGVTFVIRADESLEIVQKNDLGDGGFASISVSHSQLFVRTDTRLYCVGFSSPLATAKGLAHDLETTP